MTLFTYKNIVSDGKNLATVYQGFPKENVLDFEFVAFKDEASEEVRQKLVVRLKEQVLDVVEKPKLNARGQFLKMERVEKVVPVVHTISFLEDIQKFFSVGDTTEMMEEMKQTNIIKAEAVTTGYSEVLEEVSESVEG